MSPITRENFGSVDGKNVEKLVLDNGKIKIEILTYGGTIKSILVPDKSGQKVDDVVLGFDDMDGYLGKNERNPFLGCLVGRVANRICDAKFTLDGQTYELEKNNGENALHGGTKGFDKAIWNVKIDSTKDNTIILDHVSPDGDSGYPGELSVTVTYSLNDQNELDIAYKATTTKATPVNLTNHTYFNLAGHDAGSAGMYNHTLVFNAAKMTPVDAKTLIPTGEIKEVKDTPFDLTATGKLGEKIKSLPDEINGFDHNFCVNQTGAKVDHDLFKVCQFEHEDSGRRLECFTNQPGVQFYTGNFLPNEEKLKGKNGCFYKKHGGFCLETQAYPDSVNQTNFPNVVLRPGETYDHRTKFKFTVKK